MMGTVTQQTPTVRIPKQARSREAWERILDVGLELLKEGGADALTITEVCKRSKVSPPSLYARVDGIAGLFAAVYEYGMAEVHTTENELLADLPRAGATHRSEADAAARAVAEVFRIHGAFLRPVIGLASKDPVLLEKGSAESRQYLHRVAATLPSAGAQAYDIARTIYAECVVRTMYGAGFLSRPAETDAEFQARLADLAWRMSVPSPEESTHD